MSLPRLWYPEPWLCQADPGKIQLWSTWMKTQVGSPEMRVCQCSSWLWLSLLSFWSTPTPLPSLSLSFCPESLFSRLFPALKDQILIKVVQWFWMTNDLLSGIVLQITGKLPSLPLFINTLFFLYCLPCQDSSCLKITWELKTSLKYILVQCKGHKEAHGWRCTFTGHLEKSGYGGIELITQFSGKKKANPIGFLTPRSIWWVSLSIIRWQVSDADQVSGGQVWISLSPSWITNKATGEKHFYQSFRKDKDLGWKQISKNSILFLFLAFSLFSC